MASGFPAGSIPARGFDWEGVAFSPRRVGEFADLSYGRSLVEGRRTSGNVPVYGTNGRCGWHDEGMHPGPGVILGRKGQGPLGVEWCDGPFWVIDTAYFATVRDDIDLKWFYYIVRYVGLNHLKSGEKPGLQRDTFRAQLFPFPPKDVQTEIAHLLGALDAKITANHDVSTRLEAVATALFQSWFSDFDPVAAKRDGRRPVGVPAEAIEFFPSHFEDSELGSIPRGWRVARVDEAFELNPKRELETRKVASYLEMSAMPTVGHAPERWVSRAAGSGMRFMNGDTLMARITPCLENGKTAFVDFLEPGEVGWGSTEYIIIRSKPPMPQITSYLACAQRRLPRVCDPRYDRVQWTAKSRDRFARPLQIGAPARLRPIEGVRDDCRTTLRDGSCQFRGIPYPRRAPRHAARASSIGRADDQGRRKDCGGGQSDAGRLGYGDRVRAYDAGAAAGAGVYARHRGGDRRETPRVRLGGCVPQDSP